ncbi:alpha/beta hydrolase [Salipiger pacificus]|nr:alpha/beta hydrolase [Alloyangia pacifica]
MTAIFPPTLRAPLLALACSSLMLVGCGHAPEMIGIDNPDVPAASVAGATAHRLFITTTRQRSARPGALYSSARAHSLGLASVVVSVPPDHVPGRDSRSRSLPPDPRHDLAIVEPEVFADDGSFIAAINRELALRPPEDRDLLLFVHGYNMTLSDAVARMGQFVHDSGFRGIPVLFSWASGARLSDYVYDMNSALAARPLLQQASAILTRTDAKGFDLFAHSMGSLLVADTMVQADLQGRLGESGRLNNIMLAAPDIDMDLFRSQLLQIRNNPGNVYVLLSHDDVALSVSRRLSGGIERVGAAQDEELAGLGLTVIDLSEVQERDTLSHNKYARSPDVVKLIGESLRQQTYHSEPGPPAIFTALAGIPGLQALGE